MIVTGARLRFAAAAAVAAIVLAADLPAPRWSAPASARPLEAVRARGVLSVCAHPNALPFSSKRGSPRGLQLDLAEALARELGVGLTVEWVVSRYHPQVVDCDVIVGSIADRQAQSKRRVRLSRPYHQSGVALAFPRASDNPGSGSDTAGINGFSDLRRGQRVGVLSGSLASQYLGRRGIAIIPFGFEDDMIEALVGGEIAAAAISPATAGYYNVTHPARPVRVVLAYDRVPELSWAVAVGMRRADYPLLREVNKALERLLADGTVARIYARYGIEHRLPPRRR